MRQKGLESIEAQFGELADPRVQGRVEHRLIDIISVAYIGYLAHPFGFPWSKLNVETRFSERMCQSAHTAVADSPR